MKLAQSRVHFIGIGGIGMCGLAELLHNMGARVQGSDLSENAQVQRLQSLGIKVSVGHHSENILGVDVCVYSSAVKPDNVEYKKALELKIPMIPRAEALAEIMRLKRGVAIAGSHGKTTTTSMTAAVLLAAEMDPTIVVGGRLDLIKSTAKLGSGDWLVAEADESDGSFHRLSPEVVIITNIDNDHLDYYKTFENIQRSFLDFAHRIPFYGAAIVCGDDAETRKLFEGFQKKIIFYGFEKENQFILSGVNSSYQFFQNKDGVLEKWGEFKLAVPGRHNALNALAAVLAAVQVGLAPEEALLGLQTFNGVDRRLQMRYQKENFIYYDDYGHHPTEILAVLQALREKHPSQKVVVLFQPHRFSRTQSCWKEFTECFQAANELYLLDIYPAGEAPIAEITSEKLAQEIKGLKAQYLKSKDQAVSEISKNLKADSVFLTLGAGDVYKTGDLIVQRVQK